VGCTRQRLRRELLHGLGADVAPVGDRPFIVLLDRDGADEANDRRGIQRPHWISTTSGDSRRMTPAGESHDAVIRSPDAYGSRTSPVRVLSVGAAS
jgi:hypothetical protein